jgi:ribA/ribD-fused uncharacterized protein
VFVRGSVAAPAQIGDHPPMKAAHNLEQLKRQIDSGLRFKSVYFWSHEGPADIEVGKNCLSQWYPAHFRVADTDYATTEHYMMAEKARLFADEPARNQILRATHPGAAKALGRSVSNFDNEHWEAARWDIVVAGNLAKFTQNPELGQFLVGTGERLLVEASPVDQIWGIGLAADDPAAADPHTWRGLNLLGFALMAVREQLISGR